MNALSAIVAGLVATLVMSMVMALAPKMGFPKMDIVGMLSTMFSKKGIPVLGWMMHLMMGVIFALVYAFLWSKGIGAATWLYGLVFGAAHWLIVGVIMAMIPMLHVGIRSGSVKAPGLYMTGNGGGVKAFIGGLMGHMIFGLVVALVYALI
ncbi:MAG: hypothetical protein HY781_09730 [Chloroflexi bacterium]|nr:hypothetical protein [Chloroflexota bacterium]